MEKENNNNLVLGADMPASLFYQLAAYHKVGFQNEFGIIAYRVGEKFDETVHLQVSHLTKEKVMVTAVTELGELFIQETVQQSNPEHRTYRLPSLAA